VGPERTQGCYSLINKRGCHHFLTAEHAPR
jgi:hypothetical protein